MYLDHSINIDLTSMDRRVDVYMTHSSPVNHHSPQAMPQNQNNTPHEQALNISDSIEYTPTKNILLKLARMTRRDHSLWFLRIKPKAEVGKTFQDSKITKSKTECFKLSTILSENSTTNSTTTTTTTTTTKTKTKTTHETILEHPESTTKQECSQTINNNNNNNSNNNNNNINPTVIQKEIKISDKIDVQTPTTSVSVCRQFNLKNSKKPIAPKSSCDEAILESLRTVVRMSTKMDLSKRSTANDVYKLLHKTRFKPRRNSCEELE